MAKLKLMRRWKKLTRARIMNITRIVKRSHEAIQEEANSVKESVQETMEETSTRISGNTTQIITG